MANSKRVPKQPEAGYNGHVNINHDMKMIRYEYPNNLPIISSGVLLAEQWRKWEKENMKEARVKMMCGEKVEMVFVGVDQAKEVQKRLQEMADDMEKIIIEFNNEANK